MSDELKAKFMAAVRGIPAYAVSVALGELASAVRWTGCSKGHMADEYAYANTCGDAIFLSIGQLRNLDLDRLARMARAWASKDSNWKRA